VLIVLALRSGNRPRTNLRPYALEDRLAARKMLSPSLVRPIASAALMGMLGVQVC
jgi:hypothetical protein